MLLLSRVVPGTCQKLPDEIVANIRYNLTSTQLQTYGGVYSEEKQSGPGTLEMEYIAAYYDPSRL